MENDVAIHKHTYSLIGLQCTNPNWTGAACQKIFAPLPQILEVDSLHNIKLALPDNGFYQGFGKMSEIFDWTVLAVSDMLVNS